MATLLQLAQFSDAAYGNNPWGTTPQPGTLPNAVIQGGTGNDSVNAGIGDNSINAGGGDYWIVGYLIEANVEHTIRIWDGKHQELLQEIHGEAGSLAVSQDSHYLATGGDRKIIVWELK